MRLRPSRHLAGWFTGLVVASLAFACSKSGGDSSTTDGVTKADNTEVVDALAENFSAQMAAEVRRKAERASVTTLLDEARDLEDDSTGQGADDSDDDRLALRHLAVVRDVYQNRDGELVWYVDKGGSLEPAAATAHLRDMLVEGVRAHGLWPRELHLETVRQVGGERAGWDAEWKGGTLDDADRARLLEYLARENIDLSAPADLERLAGIVAKKDGPVPQIAERIRKRAAAVEDDIRQMARRELLLTDALAEYLVEMRYGNPAWHETRSWRASMRAGDHGPLRSTSIRGEKFETTPADVMLRAVRRARKRTMTAEKITAIFAKPESVVEQMQSVQPPFRQYDRLTRAFKRYRQYVEHGGWPELPAAAEGLREGYHSPHVATLKERLWIEGYWQPGPDEAARDDAPAGADDGTELSERFGDDLEEALAAYQETHQFFTKGVLREPTLASLNVPARERWNEIRVTLERWRASRIGADDHYVHINIPDFHAEVWRDGEREMRFRVIVGSSETEEKKNDEGEPTGERVYFRATPRFSDTIRYIVFNPFWNVPESIRAKEIKPKLRADPSYLERNNFEVASDEHGNQFIRQKPGDENSLGHIKFLFPNEHSVYMHDTPERQLFDMPTRGYSHGCIRIDEPMKFADYLLDLDGRWHGDERDKKVKKVMEKDEEEWLTLRQTLPVHIEYYVVRVDDRGRANFLADLYDLDEPRLDAVDKRLQTYPNDYDLPKRDVDELMAAALSGNLD